MQDFYFEPRRNVRNARGDGADTAAGPGGLPAAVLQRHGALVLDPDDAAVIPGEREVFRSTVYRARTLLVPGDVIHDTNTFRSVNRVLGRIGLKLTAPRVQDDVELRRVSERVADALLELPRVAVLEAVARRPGERQPEVIDAWVALQTLRAAATAEPTGPTGPKEPTKRAAAERDRGSTEHKLDQETVNRISLEHVLIGSAIYGSPAHHGPGGLTAGPDDGNSGTGPGITDSYVFTGGDTRIPVAVCLDAPERLPLGKCEDRYGRRPVVAVLDTGVRAHPWLDLKPQGGGYAPTHTDGFVEFDKTIQDAIRETGRVAVNHGDRARQVIENAWDRPVTADPLVGELDSDTGHSTFISGIVRQVAPDARVLAVRVIHSDGLVYEGDLLCGLGQVARRVALAEAGPMARMVDVVSLSLGYFSETEPKKYTLALHGVIDALLGLGVAVVAAAGNYAISRRFYPAGFAGLPPQTALPLVSVGALNPNRSKAIFSDGGGWINAWACGAIMISTFPVDIQGSRSPEIRTQAHPDNKLPAGVSLPRNRESLDPDDYHGGFAAWSGTSFSAPLLAARMARKLLQEKAAAPELWLDDPGYEAAQRRALAALTSLGWPG